MAEEDLKELMKKHNISDDDALFYSNDGKGSCVYNAKLQKTNPDFVREIEELSKTKK